MTVGWRGGGSGVGGGGWGSILLRVCGWVINDGLFWDGFKGAMLGVPI